MLMIIGLILLLVGGAGTVMFILQTVPDFLIGTPVTIGSCFVTAVIGLVIMIINRRPAN